MQNRIREIIKLIFASKTLARLECQSSIKFNYVENINCAIKHHRLERTKWELKRFQRLPVSSQKISAIDWKRFFNKNLPSIIERLHVYHHSGFRVAKYKWNFHFFHEVMESFCVLQCLNHQKKSQKDSNLLFKTRLCLSTLQWIDYQVLETFEVFFRMRCYQCFQYLAYLR